MTELPGGPGPAILATGPLTSDALAAALAAVVGPGLAFYDAIAPVVTDESVDRSVAFAASRWGKGEGDDYLNLPLDEAGLPGLRRRPWSPGRRWRRTASRSRATSRGACPSR